jgi:hypothetical protein
MLVDKKMVCIECKKDFVFTKGEQEFFLKMRYAAPLRCADCRKARKRDRKRKRREFFAAINAAEDVKMNITPQQEPAKKKKFVAMEGMPG